MQCLPCACRDRSKPDFLITDQPLSSLRVQGSFYF